MSLRPDGPDDSARGLLARLDLFLLALALLAAVVLGTQNLHAPWEDGFKGANGGAYTTRFLQHDLELGLSVTRGGLVVDVQPIGVPQPIFYLNHPATYTLIQLVPAELFGLSEAGVRLVALLLWLPALPALWWIGRRLLGPPAGGVCALLLACVPMTAYYGPMAIPDGALAAGFLLVAAAFLAHVAAPTRRSALRLGAVFVYAVLLDWSSAWLLPLLAVLAFATVDRRRAWVTTLRLALLALLPVALLFAHTALLVGSFREAAVDWGHLGEFSQSVRPGRGDLLTVETRDALTLYGPRLLLLAGAGVLVAMLAPRAWGLRRALPAAAALLLPGVAQVLAVPSHAREHEFWSMYGAPGLVLAASLPLAAALRWRATASGPRARRLAGAAAALLLVAYGDTAWCGARDTRARTASNATTFHRDLGQSLNAWFGPGDIVATNIEPAVADVYARATMIGPVNTPVLVQRLLSTYAPPRFTGKLAFLLPAHDRESPLGRMLATLATPEPVTGGLLFRLRP